MNFNKLRDLTVFIGNFSTILYLTLELLQKMILNQDFKEEITKVHSQIGFKFYSYISKYKNFNYNNQ